MKTGFICILLLIGITVCGQDTLRKKKFYIGAFISPDYSYRSLYNNTGIAKTIADIRNTIEIPKFTYTVGLDFLYQVNKRIALNLGIDYSIKGEQTSNITYTFGPPPRRGMVYNSSYQAPTNGYTKYNTTYIDIPLRIDIYLSKRKVAPFITTGVSTNIFLYEKDIAYLTYADGHHATSSSTGSYGFYKVNPQFQLGGGIDISFKKSRLRVLPIARVSVLRVNSGTINDYFYSFGLGVSYLFGI
ncbi:MAG: outer membrane beta-barrel protein [Bacteroidia bacterium]